MLSTSLFTDVIVSCGALSSDGLQCYVKNDGLTVVNAQLQISQLNVRTGQVTSLLSSGVQVGAGPATIRWYNINTPVDARSNIILIELSDASTGAVITKNTDLLTEPKNMTLLLVELSVTVASRPNSDGLST